jgi:PAT family beta-lactamase induction signal transducer AmpG
MSTQEIFLPADTQGSSATMFKSKYFLLAFLIASRWVVYGFLDVALTAVLRKSGVSLTQISLMLGVGFLFMFKFLWAPLVDRIAIFGVYGYKRWFLITQTLVAIFLLGLLWLHPAKDFYWVFGLLVFASIAATFRDVSIDALAVKILTEEERATANGWMSTGFMLGMVLGGGVLLLLYDTIGWEGAVWAISIGTMIAVPVMLFFKEPEQKSTQSAGREKSHMLSSLRDFFRRPGRMQWAGLILIMAMAGITGPSLIAVMLIDNGWSLARVGGVTNIAGPLVAAVLSLAAGYVFTRISRRVAVVSMLLGGALLSFIKIPVAYDGYPMWATMTVVITSVVIATLTNIAQKIIVMDKSTASPDFGSNFTIQVSLAQIGGTISMMAAPALAEMLGYPAVLAMGGCLGLIAAFLLSRYKYLEPLQRTAPHP